MNQEQTILLVMEALAEPAFRRRLWVWWIALRNGYLVPIETCLTGFSRDAVPATRLLAGRLVLLHGDTGRDALATLLSEGSPDERATAALVLAEQGDDSTFDVLISELASGYSNRKWVRHISRAIIRYYRKQLVAWVDAEKPDVAGRPGLAWSIAQVRIADGEATAEDVFHHGTPSARAAVARQLAQQKGADFLPDLRRCLREGQPRKVAQEAFRQMHHLGDTAMPMVKEMLKSKQWTERKAAVCLLRRWGRLDPEQKARAEGDPHIAVRHAGNWLMGGDREGAK